MTAAYDDLPRRQFLVGDASKQLRRLPEASVDCVITSPPYFALRDYGNPAQIGAEASVQQWVAELVNVAAELRRVLKPTGALWLTCVPQLMADSGTCRGGTGRSAACDWRSTARSPSTRIGHP